jgi:amino acid transporter
MVSRIFYGMSINNWIPEIFSKVNEKTRTPIFSTIFSSFAILVFTLWLPILTLASMTSFLIFIIFTLMNLALIRIKLKNPKAEGIISYPIIFPILGIIVNLIILFIQVFSII